LEAGGAFGAVGGGGGITGRVAGGGGVGDGGVLPTRKAEDGVQFGILPAPGHDEGMGGEASGYERVVPPPKRGGGGCGSSL